jgi:hypothetical protein
MNRNFETSSKRTRIAAALVAVLCSVLVASGIEGLAGHYQAQSQLAGQPTAQVAQR